MTYRDKIKTIVNIDNKLDLFKNYIINQITKLNEEQTCEKAINPLDYAQWSNAEREEFDDKWDYIGSDAIENLFSEMGWQYSELSKQRSTSKSSISDCVYVYYGFNDAWKKIKDCDTVDFCYAMIALSKELYTATYIGKFLTNITSNGLDKYDLIELKNTVLNARKPTIFVAMWFSDKMNLAKEQIIGAIESYGFEAVIMNEKQYNNFIMPEMFYEINESTFVIADFTRGRKSVYFEAGYAKALNKEVIMTCKSGDFSDDHFDTEQINHILWDDEKDLYSKLLKRIQATVYKIKSPNNNTSLPII